MKRWLLLGILTLALLKGAKAQNQGFRAEVDREQVATNETFRVTFKLQGKGHSFRPPSFRYFKVLWGPAKSVKKQSINGNFSVSYSFTYKLQPKRKGSFRIGSAKVVQNGKTLTTDPLTIKVTDEKKPGNGKGKDKRALTQRIKDNLYIQCNVNNARPYRGEQIRAEYKLYINVGVTDYEVKSTPQFNGFWKETIKDPEKFNVQVERVNGQRFKTAVLSKVALFPQRAGKLTLDPFKMKFSVRYRADGEGNGLFSRFRRSYKTKTLNIQSDPVTIDVKPLPDTPSSGFSGLVGQFDLSSNLNRKQTRINKPVALELTVSGEGNLNKLQPLKLAIPPAFSTYTPKVDNNVSTNRGVVQGAKSFEYLLVPRAPGKHKLGSIGFTYFDPEKAQYVTRTTPAYTLHVRSGRQGVDSVMPGSELLSGQPAVQEIDQDIRYIQVAADGLTKHPMGFVFSTAFWGLTVTPFLLAGGVLWWQRKGLQGLTTAKGKQAKSLADQHLKDAEKAMKSGDDGAFYEAISWALWRYVGAKTGLKIAEMTQDTVQQRLLAHGCHTATVQTFLSLIQTCEEATYTHSGGSTGKQALYDQTVNLIKALEAELPAL